MMLMIVDTQEGLACRGSAISNIEGGSAHSMQ